VVVSSVHLIHYKLEGFDPLRPNQFGKHMNKRTLGNALTTLGSPAMLGWMGTFNCFTADGNLKDLLWAVPLTLITLPLLPVWLKGEKILTECNEEDFKKRTAHLPKVHNLSIADNVHIEESEGKFFIWPFYIQDGEDGEPFDSEEETRTFLKNLGYIEVVDPNNYQGYLCGTLWIKQKLEEDCFLCKGLCKRDHD
jgi:hypothetical protein